MIELNIEIYKTNFLGNLKQIFSLEKHDLKNTPVGDTLCDGMTIDTDGNLWVALFKNSKVIKIDPRKPETLLQTLEFPAKYVSFYFSVNKYFRRQSTYECGANIFNKPI